MEKGANDYSNTGYKYRDTLTEEVERSLNSSGELGCLGGGAIVIIVIALFWMLIHLYG